MNKDLKKITDDFYIAAFDPDESSFAFFAAEGIRSVINLQTEDEEQQLSHEEEKKLANDMNLEYRHLGVSSDRLSGQLVDSFRNELEQLPKPVVVHCTSGKRSGAFVMMHVGSNENMSGEEVIKKAEEMGFECDEADLEQFVKNYVNEH